MAALVAVLLILLATAGDRPQPRRLHGVIFTGYTRWAKSSCRGGGDYGPDQYLAAILPLYHGGPGLDRPGVTAGRLAALAAGSIAALWGSLRLMPRLVGKPAPLTASAVLVGAHDRPAAAGAFPAHADQSTSVPDPAGVSPVSTAAPRIGRPRLGCGGESPRGSVAFLPYLLYKRAWRAIPDRGFLVVLNVFLPVTAFGPKQARHWRSGGRLPAQRRTIRRPAIPIIRCSQRSSDCSPRKAPRDPVHTALAAWPTTRVVHLFYALLAAAAPALAIAWARNSPDLANPRVFGELAIGLVLMPLVAPLAWKPHFVTLLVGYWLIWRAIPGKRRELWTLWWASFACLTLSAPALLGAHVRSVLESLNVITVGALLVLGLTIWAARQPPPRPRANSEAPR